MSAIPKGEWNCAYCIIDETVAGDKKAAKQAIRSMTRLAHGLETADTTQASSSSSSKEVDSSYRLGKAGEITIAHTGRKFIVRKRLRKQIEELGR